MEHNKLNTYFLGAITILLLITMIVSWQTSSNLKELTDVVLGKVPPPQQQAQQAQPTQQPTTGSAEQRVNLEVGNAPTKGPNNAKVTIVVFSDPSCPFCGAAAGKNQQIIDYLKTRDSSWTPAIPGIIKDYVDTGKARIVFKFFPGHGAGADAMKIMWCANEQDKFWEIHDVMFANQDKMNPPSDMDVLKQLAVSSGLDSAKLDSCLTENSAAYDTRMGQETQEGRAARVTGTPAFFINGKIIEGAVSYGVIKQVIDAELA